MGSHLYCFNYHTLKWCSTAASLESVERVGEQSHSSGSLNEVQTVILLLWGFLIVDRIDVSVSNETELYVDMNWNVREGRNTSKFTN